MLGPTRGEQPTVPETAGMGSDRISPWTERQPGNSPERARKDKKERGMSNAQDEKSSKLVLAGVNFVPGGQVGHRLLTLDGPTAKPPSQGIIRRGTMTSVSHCW